MSPKILVLVVSLCACAPLYAQSARVSGRVTDSNEAAVKGSSVTLKALDTDVQYRTTSAEDGNFLLPPVPPGRYEIGASADGFATTRITDLILELGESRVIAIGLKPQSVHESVTISDTPPELTTDRPDRSVVIDRNFVDAIKVWTLDGAYATFEEKSKGSITVGKLADFAVLRKDPRSVAPDSIKDIVVDATYVAGENVWQAPAKMTAAMKRLVPGIDFGDGDEEDNLGHINH